MKRSFFRHFTRKWIWIVIAACAVIGLFAYARSGKRPPQFESAVAEVGTVSERVSVTGAVLPVDKADLAFQKSGVVSAIYVRVGDAVKKGDKIASLDSRNDEAALASAEATLADASRNLTAEEINVQETAVHTARTSLLNSVRDALIKVQSALFNYTDTFFNYPQGPNPTISIHVDSVVTQNAINTERLQVTDALKGWSDIVSSMNEDTAPDAAQKTLQYLRSIKSFMNDLSQIVNSLTPANSGASQTAINAYLATMNTGMSNLNAALDSVASAETALETAQSNYDLKLAGNSEQSIAALSAKVDQARVQVDEDTIRAPIDGVITKADPSEGEFIAAGTPAFSVQNSMFKIEAYVPEADIAKVARGNIASSTLDAYGTDTDFPAEVTAIDPAETILEGVPTYKVTLIFMAPDSRIRSGMTANLDIHTRERIGVLEIPYRAIDDADGAKTVKRVSADGLSYVSVPVTTGLKGSDGTIEITSGLSAGDRVVTYLK